MIKLTRAFFILFICSLSTFQTVCADPIDEVVNSKDFDRIKRQMHTPAASKIREQELKQFKQTNLGQVFFGPGKGKVLLDWLAGDVKGFKAAHKTGEIKPDYAEATATFDLEGSDATKRTVLVLVPKPSSMSARNYKLITEFNDLEPPRLKISGHETFDIKGTPADFYQKPDGGCSLLIKLEVTALLNISQDSCKNINDLIEFAGMLNISRLNRKLTS